VDMFPLTGSVPAPLWSRVAGDGNNSSSLLEKKLTPDTHCLLSLDLRNAWPSQMTVHLSAAEDDDGNEISVTEQILPGHTARVLLPIRRVYVEDPHAFVPALNPARQRQFVVSTKISPEAERASREAFWYRERILDGLRGRWETDGGKRTGEVEMRAIRLTQRMVEVVRVEEVSVDVEVLGGVGEKKKGGRYVVEVDSFLELVVKVTNRSAKPIYPLLRLTPVLRHRPFHVSLDFTRKMARFAWNGNLQQALPLLAGNGGSVEVRIGVTPLCRGEFEVLASVEEARLWMDEGEERKVEERLSREVVAAMSDREANEMILGAATGRRERRVWFARRGCVLVVREGRR
jgi:hypothetical protein